MRRGERGRSGMVHGKEGGEGKKEEAAGRKSLLWLTGRTNFTMVEVTVALCEYHGF